MPTHKQSCVIDVPRLDAPVQYQELDHPDAGYPQIRLPSGHVAAHLTRYADVRAALGDPSVSRKLCNVEGGPTFLPGPTQKELLLNLDMPEHARSRSLVAQDFSPRGVEALRPFVTTRTHQCIDEMLSGERPPDVFQAVLQDVTVSTVCQILGIPPEDRTMFRQWSRVIQVASKKDVAAIEVAVKASFDYLLDFVQGRRQADPDGFIRRHADARTGAAGELSDEDIVGVLLGILLGGDHNSLSVMTKATYTLLCLPDLWRRVVDEPTGLPKVIEELIRVIPIGLLSTFPRVATSALETSVGTIPPGTPLYANVFLANRDPEVFPQPLSIDPDRGGKPHMQFGFGVHTCMGPSLARMEMAIVLGALAERVPGMALSAEPASLRWIDGTVLRRPDELPITFKSATTH